MNNTLTITDNRTGKAYTLPIENNTIRSMDLRQIKTGPEDFGLMGYDPAFMNTASCKSSVTFIDGDKGILRYRGYPIEQLAEHCTFLDVAYLLIHGELPTERMALAEQFCSWSACRMNRMSSARARMGFARYFGSTIRHSMFMKFSG